MTTIGFDQTLIARVASGLYNMQLGNATMDWALEWVNGLNGTVYDLANEVYTRDFAAVSTADVASILVTNLGITGAPLVAAATDTAKSYLDAAAPEARGAVVIELMNLFAGLEIPAYAPFVAAYNAQVAAAVLYAQTPGSVDVPLDQPESMEGMVFNLATGNAAGADVMRLTGDQDVRIDFTNPANQVTGLDLDGDGTIEFDGAERSVTGVAANFEIVDAYARNPLNQRDSANNFLGDIAFDGTGYDGDGTSTDGNIVLGGLGIDNIFGGIGNDFLAGGGVAQDRAGEGFDALRGGRNADFFFAEFSGIDATDGGQTLFIDGGNTADDSSAGTTQTPQDSDWLLFEASDDDEPVQVRLEEDPAGVNDDDDVLARSGEFMDIDEIENFDASGNLYGFLDDIDVEIGGRAMDTRDVAGSTNYGFGSSAQLRVYGSEVANIIIAGYDNDVVWGDDGDDLLMGGNLNFLNNPNLLGITNNGMDELYGEDGDDSIVFEADGGIIDGGSGQDTLWLTRESLGTQTAAQMTDDGVLRFDLLADSISASAGYGGADALDGRTGGDGTQDQTNYKSGGSRVDMTSMDSVIATGLGGVDYLAAGTNDPDLTFDNQQNHFAYTGALDLRGTEGANTLYSSNGNDVIEGRGGDDSLSGGGGNDDFYFGTANGEDSIGDGVDVIHRQTDANGDNLWDTDAEGTGLFERDFNIGGTTTVGASTLTVDLGTTDLASPDVALTSFSVKIAGVTFSVADSAALIAATTASQVAALVNTFFGAQDARVSASASGNVITLSDTAGRDISDTVAEGYAVGGVVSNGAFSAQALFAPAGTSVTQDRLIYKSYEDRADNEGVDDDSSIGSNISLGIDAYAEDLVISFADEDGDGMATTRLAEDQQYALTFDNLTTKDKVTVSVNGINYALTVGLDLDGNVIAAEDGVGDSQAGIQAAFLSRLTDFINSYMDDDTSAGEVGASLSGSTLYLSQVAYSGEETVFMRTPVVTLTNASGGQPATVEIANVSQHEVELLDFDGRNGELNATNVLFVGESGISRAVLATAKTAGGVLNGSEALVIDVGPNNLQDTVFGTTTIIPNNTATNAPLSDVANGFAVHGDDFLLGGAGLDTINGGTGDDRVEGSVGGNGTTTWDTLDGGKNFYAVQVLGEAQARVYVLNKWEAANPTKVTALQGLTISSLELIDQTENGQDEVSGVFDDTLQFTQNLFTPGATRFTVTLDNFTLTGGVVELRNDGAGTVGVDVDGNGTIDNWTRFTNFENIRTVSGTGNAVAGSGQGNDTLNVSALSSATTGANGVLYNLTNGTVNGFAAGSVLYSANAHASLTKPATADFESLVLRVDGVENVIGGTGDDLLVIDETEAAKNNVFTGDLGDDRIIYRNDFGTVVGEPTITIKVDNVAAGLGGTDTVTSTGGRVGSTMAVDTLNGVEFISLESNTAASVRENDVLDTSSISGATVSYLNGQVTAGGATHVTIDGLVQVERVDAGAGNDVVIVADADVMNNNLRSDELDGTPSKNILFMTYRDFDELNTGATTRRSFADQVLAGTIQKVINQGEFTFSLGGGTDRVDYSNEAGRIVVPVGQGTATTPQYVVVDGDNDQNFADSESRVDALFSVEEIVAAQGRSVMDFTAVGQARQITFQYVAPSGNPADKQVIEQIIRIADGSGNTLSGLNAFVEKYTYDSPTSLLPAVADATWNQIEGSDAAEVVIYQGSEDLVNAAGIDHRYTQDVLTLRGGANEVRYSPLETSISASIAVQEEVLTTAGAAEGLITATITFQDGKGVNAPSGTFLGGQHTITSHTSDNSTVAGSLKIEGSQDAEDVVSFTSATNKVFILGTSPGVINVNIGTSATMVLTGFEFVLDSVSDDVYDVRSISNLIGLNLLDNDDDHDAIRVANDSVNYNGSGLNTIDLDNLSATAGGYNFDFDVLDLTNLTSALTGLTVNGGTDVAPVETDPDEVADNTDEVVLGALARVSTINDFESMVLTDASVAAGANFTFNPGANTLTQGSTTVITSADALSFGGLVREQTTGWGKSYVANVATGVTVNVAGTAGAEVHGGAGADTITGGGAADVIRGNGGNDTLSGGVGTEVRTVQLDLSMDGAAGGSVAATFNGFSGAATTVTEGAEIAVGAGSNAVASALAAKLVANLAAINTGAAWSNGGQLVSVGASGNILTFTFNAGADVLDGEAITLAAAGDAGIVISGTTITEQGGNGGADTFIFEATAAANGVDTLNNFNMAGVASDDVLDFTAFLGGVGVYDTDNDEDASFEVMTLSGGENIGLFYNSAALTAARVELSGSGTIAAGDVVIANNAKAVVLVTADVDGNPDGTNQAYSVYFVQDTDATAGFSPSVALVGTINSAGELDAFLFSDANFS